MSDSLKGVEPQIEAALRDVDEHRRLRGAHDYTKAVKIAVKGVGERLGFKIYASGIGSDGTGERMYDLSWWKENDPYLIDEPLVLECEWGASRFHVI